MPWWPISTVSIPTRHAEPETGWIEEDELFSAEQNAVVVLDADECYQQMYCAEVSSWNLRDRHVANSTSADSHANASASTRGTRSNPGTHPTGI